MFIYLFNPQIFNNMLLFDSVVNSMVVVYAGDVLYCLKISLLMTRFIITFRNVRNPTVHNKQHNITTRPPSQFLSGLFPYPLPLPPKKLTKGLKSFKRKTSLIQ